MDELLGGEDGCITERGGWMSYTGRGVGVSYWEGRRVSYLEGSGIRGGEWE